MLPAAVERGLRQLGENLYFARKRRKQSLAAWSERLQVSIPTLERMEAGDPAVSAATYMTAIWLVGKLPDVLQPLDPCNDEVALLNELRNIPQPRKKKA